MSSSLFDTTTPAEVLTEVFDKDKFNLVCNIHHFAYGSKTLPNFKCKKCTMVSFVGLMCNTPPSKRAELMDALEASIHKMIESEQRGELKLSDFYGHPQVTIEKE